MIDYPRLTAGCSFHPFDNGGGREEYVLATEDGRQFRVSALAYQILRRLDGHRRIPELVRELNDEAIPINEDQLRQVLDQQYGDLGVIEDGRQPVPEQRKLRVRRKPGFPLLLTVTLLPQPLVAALGRALSWLYSPLLVVPLLAWIAWSHAGVYRVELDVLQLSSTSYLWIVVLCLGSIVIHELGHAAAVSRFGGQPGPVGCGLYFLLPTFYADVSQLWRFPRRQRMVVDLGGVYFQLIAFGLMAWGAARWGSPELLATCRLIDIMVLTALNPLFHFDGYWFLADYLALPKLQRTALDSLTGRLKRWAGRRVELPSLPPLGLLARSVFHSYSVLSVAFLGAVFWILYRYLSSALFRLAYVAPEAVEKAGTALHAGDAGQLFIQLLTLFFLFAFPLTALVGLGLSLTRVARMIAERILHRSSNVPS